VRPGTEVASACVNDRASGRTTIFSVEVASAPEAPTSVRTIESVPTGRVRVISCEVTPAQSASCRPLTVQRYVLIVTPGWRDAAASRSTVSPAPMLGGSVKLA
jgi:hypothetical protein